MYRADMRWRWAGPASWRDWAKVVAGGVALAALIVGLAWTGRYALTIYRLRGSVGDTVFLDADGKPWFRLNEQRHDVPFDQISTSFKIGRAHV